MKKIKFEDSFWLSNTDQTRFSVTLGDYTLIVAKHSRSNWNYFVDFKGVNKFESSKPTTTHLRAIGVCEGYYLNDLKTEN